MTLRRARAFLCCLSLVCASPLPLSKRDDSRSSVPASIYTPTVIIFVVFVGLAALGCFGRAFLRHSRATQIANVSAATNRTGNATDQLTSAINADVVGGRSNTTANPTRVPRRNRRPRRTPSQVSVTSLPEYMKEPGENELVIGQSPARTHTLTMPMPHHQLAATTIMDHLSDDEDTRTQTRAGSSRYYPIPTSANTLPLLHEQQDQEQTQERGRDRNSNDNDNTTDDISLQDLPHQSQRTGELTSIDTTTRFESANTHIQSLSPTSISTLPQDAAPLPPAYFEVVADDDVPLSAQTYYPPHASSSRYSILSSSTSTFSTSNAPLLGHNASRSTSMLPEAARASTTRANNQNRQSGFRTFLNRVSMSMPIGGPSNGAEVTGSGPGHQRSESTNSNISTTSFFRRPGSSLSSISLAMNQNQSHHTRQNQSISLLSSPSTVSINSLSISAPLTHTASRTQFTFPQSAMTTATTKTTKTGAAPVVMMTPEQVRVIAAREAIGRFGVPYGPDAVAFAAAKGVGEAGPPPPEFEEVVGEGSGSRLDGEDEDEEGRGEGRHGVREISASASSMATVRMGHRGSETVSPGSDPSEIDVVQDGASSQARTPSQSPSRDAIVEPKPNIPSTSSGISLRIKGINASPLPSPSASTSPTTPTPVSMSEFGVLSSKLLSPNNNNNNDVVRSGSITSNYSTQTYATAAESLSLSSSVPLTTTSSNSTSRSSSYSAAGGVDVIRGWSSSEEEDEGRGMVDEVGSVTPRIARIGLDRAQSGLVVSGVV